MLSSLAMSALCAAAFAPGSGLHTTAHRRFSSPTMAISPGDRVAVVGSGPIAYLAARLSLLRGFKTTLFLDQNDMEVGQALIEVPEGATLDFVPIAGPKASGAEIDAAVAQANGLVIAFDKETAINDKALSVFTPEGANLKHISVMSRYLNGQGMGFFANAAKTAANKDIWNGNAPAVAGYKTMEAGVKARAKAINAKYTIIRAGTLKAGAIGDAQAGGGGESSFLKVGLYDYGQQDIVNWRLIYDCNALGVKLVKGDVLPGPGFTAALTATSETGGDGDSHRGAVAAALVEALRLDVAEDGDFSVGSEKGTTFPSEAEWASMFKSAA